MNRVLWLTILLISPALAQTPVNPRLLAARWPAQWIAAPGTAPFDYGLRTNSSASRQTYSRF